MVKLQEEKDEEEEVQVLLLSTLCSCSRLDPVPALAADGISLLGRKLSHPSPSVRREAAAAMMALRSVTSRWFKSVTSCSPLPDASAFKLCFSDCSLTLSVFVRTGSGGCVRGRYFPSCLIC